MTPAEGIGKLGFRRWYERQLIEGHASLVTCLLSLILVAVCLEQVDFRASLVRSALMIALVAVGAAVCVRSVMRYGFLLFRAEALGAQSSCAQCRTYGVLQVLSAGRPQPDGDGDSNPWIRVRCKKCGHEWRMENS